MARDKVHPLKMESPGSGGTQLDDFPTSLNPQEVARLVNDPFGLTDVASRVPALSSGWSSNAFSSDEGRFRILFISAPEEATGLWTEREWVKQVIGFVQAWKERGKFDDTLKVTRA